MEDPISTINDVDASPDVVTQKTWDEVVQNVSTPGKYGEAFASTNFKEGIDGWRLNSNGIAEFSGLIIRDVLYTVPTNGSIQNAINILNNAGGGTVQLQSGTYTLTSDLILSDGIKLVGVGKDSTIIEFSSLAYNIKAVGTSGDILQNWSIQNLTIQNSNLSTGAGIQLDYTDNWLLDNVKVTSCNYWGVDIARSQNGTINNCEFSSNSLAGLMIHSTSSNSRQCGYINISNCRANSNGEDGFFLNAGNTSPVTNFVFTNCHAESNTLGGFYLVRTGSSTCNGQMIGCTAVSNGDAGFESLGCRISAICCYSYDNTSYGFNMIDGALIGCKALLNDTAGGDINIRSGTGVTETTVIGCEVSPGNTTKASAVFPVKDKLAFVAANRGTSVTNQQTLSRMYNNSGGTIDRGDVVRYGADASGEYVTTTTTVGDDYVFGMSDETTTNGSYGIIRTTGVTDYLKVNGTTDIAIGDFLCTYSTAKIAQKAAAGDMAFAIALEAYTSNDSNGVITALLITPRKL